jgi:protein TonB
MSDPAYPLELMKQHVQGTVTLYAVIGSDGSVSGVRVLNGIDDRLDQYASEAFTRWHFRPASKNGAPVALAAVVRIPFHPARARSAF